MKQTAPATFSLREVLRKPLQTVKETYSEMIRSEEPGLYDASPEGKAMPFLQAAETVLEFFGNEQPLHYGEITEKARRHGWLDRGVKSPAATMNAQLSGELKSARVSGKRSHFFRASSGYYGLVKWLGSSSADKGGGHNRKIRSKLLSQIGYSTPEYFQDIIGQLLVAMGFESIEIDPHGSADGVEVRGTLKISDAIRLNMIVSAMNRKEIIQSSTVQRLRRRLGAYEQGLIITTSHFSAGAIKEANLQDTTPVALINGKKFVGLLMEYNIGVNRIPYELFELEKITTEKRPIY